MSEALSPAVTEVRAVLDAWIDLVKKNDLDAVMALYSNDIRSFDAVLVQEIKGKEAYLEHWKKCMEMCAGGATEFIMERRDESIEAEGDLAFASYILRCGMRKEDGTEEAGLMRATFCLKRLGDQWLIVHDHHSSPFNPLDNTVIMASD
jgi:ketosteroid isomerase-like protein